MLLPAATQVQRTASGISVPVSDCGSVPDLARIWRGSGAGQKPDDQLGNWTDRDRMRC